MPRSPDERIESLEKRLNTYRVLAILLFVLLVITHRHQLITWADGVQNWMTAAANARG